MLRFGRCLLLLGFWRALDNRHRLLDAVHVLARFGGAYVDVVECSELLLIEHNRKKFDIWIRLRFGRFELR